MLKHVHCHDVEAARLEAARLKATEEVAEGEVFGNIKSEIFPIVLEKSIKTAVGEKDRVVGQEENLLVMEEKNIDVL